MGTIQAYEANLENRLAELRQGDDAYKMHLHSIQEVVAYAHNLHSGTNETRILDCGCGLGFASAWLNHLGLDVVGIDPSEKSISLAKQEHPNIPFHQASAESFPDMMPELGLEPFDQAILNMVLHSVDDSSVLNILRGVRKSLRPEGAIHLLVPTQEWLVQKLQEYAEDEEMEESDRTTWILEMLKKKELRLPVKIRGGEYYPEPLVLYNRTIDDYGRMLEAAGFGVRINYYYEGKNEPYQTIVPYLLPDDELVNYDLAYRQRKILVSFTLAE